MSPIPSAFVSKGTVDKFHKKQHYLANQTFKIPPYYTPEMFAWYRILVIYYIIKHRNQINLVCKKQKQNVKNQRIYFEQNYDIFEITESAF
mgnify:CR=1 FL=1